MSGVYGGGTTRVVPGPYGADGHAVHMLSTQHRPMGEVKGWMAGGGFESRLRESRHADAKGGALQLARARRY